MFKTHFNYRSGFPLALLILLSALGLCAGADLVDNFADRQVVTSMGTNILTVVGSNVGATNEVDEPRHAGKNGGHSVWISWTPQSDGIATINTAGSTFDTLVGVYILEIDPTKTPMKNLKSVGCEDDDKESEFSQVQFGVRAGTTYQIAVDGYEGAKGSIKLTLYLQPTSVPPPIILNMPGDRSVQPGDTVTLAVSLQTEVSLDDLKFKWRLNGEDVTNTVDGSSSTLVITNFQDSDVGEYRFSIRVDGIWFDCHSIELQLNSEGATNALARNKVLDAPDSGIDGSNGNERSLPKVAFVGGGGVRPRIGVIRGYDGNQVFSTIYATSDPAEPQLCATAPGASYWLGYKPPTGGVAHLDTIGSNFDTVLAVYSYLPPLLGYQQLVPVDCDDNGATNGLASWLEFVADPLKNYIVVVAGVNGSRGRVNLHYSLATNQPPVEVNLAPVLPTILPITVNPLALLTVTNTASEPNTNATTSRYILLVAPEGAAIDANGVITWTPSMLQGASTNVITTVAINTDPLDLITPQLSATNSFVVVVNEMNLPPSLPQVDARIVLELSSLVVTNSATAANPRARVFYSLIRPPGGLKIDTNGIITWIPTATQGPGNYRISTVATSVNTNDLVNPQLSVTNSFMVTVVEPVVSQPVATTSSIVNSVLNISSAAVIANSLSATGSSTVTVVEPIVSQPVVITYSIVSSGLNLAWNTNPGKNYKIQYTEDPRAGNWQDLTGNILATGDSLSSNVPITGPIRFYRVMMPP